MALALRDADAGQNVWLWGMKGTGKTTFAQQFAGRLGRPFFLVPVDGTTEKSEVIGDNGIKGDGKGGKSDGDGSKEGNGDSDYTGDGDGNKGGGQQRG